MTSRELIAIRLHNLHITDGSLSSASAIVSKLGAIQAQDYAGAKWSIGLRLSGSTEKDIDKAIADRSIIRTWPMRGTLHFVAAEDTRWMLKLLTPRIIAGMAGRNRQLELDDAIFSKSRDLLISEMEGGKQLTRGEAYALFEKNGINPAGQRGIHILNYLAQNQIICHGVHNEKQPTYALLDEWISKSNIIEGDEALSEIAYRYFAGHGPATLNDFVWWTGLKISDAKKGLQLIEAKLTSVESDNMTYWMTSELLDSLPVKSVHLLPGFDEYMLGYTNRTLMVPPAYIAKIVPGNNGMFMPTIVVNGEVKGLWRRTLKKDKVHIELLPFNKLAKGILDKITVSAKRYARYLGKELAMFQA